MRSNQRAARTSGLLYLVVTVTGVFSLAYVPAQMHVAGDALATVDNVVALESLFRLGILSELIQYTVFLPLAFALYRLLRKVDETAASLMVAFIVVSIPVALSNVVNELNILSLLRGAEFMQAFTQAQLRAQVMSSFDAYNNGLLVCKIFWGLWLLPFGYLVFRSGFLPRVLGILLMLGCFSYLADFLADLMNISIPSFVMLPASIGELGTCLWLLIIGVKPPFRAGPSLSSTATGARP